jgi:hypothetical protein
METDKRPMTTARRLSWMAARWGGRALRVSFAWMVLIGFLALVVARVTIAAAADAGMNFSDELMRVGEHHVGGEVLDSVYDIELNGQTFYSSNSASPKSMEAVLDYFQAQCRHHSMGLRDSFEHLDTTMQTLPDAPTASADSEGVLVVRKDAGDRGYIFCVAPDHTLTRGEIVERIARFGRTGDLSSVGELRYIATRKAEDVTQVVTAWTAEPLRLAEMFPVEGEVPGVDYGNVPRPDGARRTLSGSIKGSPFGLNTYEVHGAVPSVLSNVDAKLTAAGWRRESGGPDIPENGRFYALGSSLDLVVAVDDVGSGLTRATYAVSYNRGRITF